MYIHIYIYICIEREREWGRETKLIRLMASENCSCTRKGGIGLQRCGIPVQFDHPWQWLYEPPRDSSCWID